MVSASTRRLPSTTIEETVWAAAGDETSDAVTTAATGTARKREATTAHPLSTRIPTFMRQATLSFHCRPPPKLADRFPRFVVACSQFYRTGKRRLTVQFQFLTNTLPRSNGH